MPLGDFLEERERAWGPGGWRRKGEDRGGEGPRVTRVRGWGEAGRGAEVECL